MNFILQCGLVVCQEDSCPESPLCAEHHREWAEACMAEEHAGREPLPIHEWVRRKNHSGEVVYEAWFRASKTAYERFGKALLYHKVKLVDSFVLTGAPTVLVKGTPAAVLGFAEACRLEDVRYRSPTVFDNGTLVPIYASPEDDIAGRKTKGALYVEAAQRRRQT